MTHFVFLGPWNAVAKTWRIFAANFITADLDTFKALGLSSTVLKALEQLGFEQPTEIQQQAIPILLSEPRDFIGLAQTGTGKTAAFGLPLIELIEPEDRNTQALILAPTRELAQQIAQQLQSFSRYSGKLNIVCVFGGASISTQINEVRRGAQIIVATPGRLIDLNKRGAVRLDKLEFVILDEADEMLNMGFKDDLDYILGQAPEDKITWLFSATMPKEIKNIVKNYMINPAEVRINSGQVVNANIEHQYAVIKASDKVEALRRMLDFNPDMYGVVFCRTKRDTQKVADELVNSGYAAEPLHGDLSQSQRDSVMRKFKSRTVQLMIATDVAARGIDVNDLTHVVHFALPDDPEYYTHRSGRTARAGRQGISISLITRGEMRRVKFLESKLGIKFDKAMIPAIEDIAKNRISHWASKLAQQDITKKVTDEMMSEAQMILADFSREDIIAKLISAQLDRISSKNSLNDLNDNSKLRQDESGYKNKRGKERRQRDSRGQEVGMHRYFINLGTIDQFNKGALLKFICDESGLKGREIGRITLDQRHSFFDVSEDSSSLVRSLNGKKFEGREIRVNRDDMKGGGKKGKKKKPGARKKRK